MQKKDMIKDLAVKYNISQAESKRIFDAVFDQLSEVLSHGGYFTEAGFGTFTIAHVKKRKGYNPAIQKFMMLPPKLKPKFKSSDLLKSRINGWSDDTVVSDDADDDIDDNELLDNDADAAADYSIAQVSGRGLNPADGDAAIKPDDSIYKERTANEDVIAESVMRLDSGDTVPSKTVSAPGINRTGINESEMVTAVEQSALIADDDMEAADARK